MKNTVHFFAVALLALTVSGAAQTPKPCRVVTMHAMVPHPYWVSDFVPGYSKPMSCGLADKIAGAWVSRHHADAWTQHRPFTKVVVPTRVTATALPLKPVPPPPQPYPAGGGQPR